MEREQELGDVFARSPWHRSSSCPEIDCVEVRFLRNAVLMRDSKLQHRQLRFSLPEWRDFLQSLRIDPNPVTAFTSGTRIASAGLEMAETQAAGGAVVIAAAKGGE